MSRISGQRALDVPFLGGVDDSADPALQGPRLRVVQNLRADRQGRLVPRKGMAQMADADQDGTTISDTWRGAFAVGSDVGAFTDSTVYAYAPAATTGSARWIARDDAISLRCSAPQTETVGRDASQRCYESSVAVTTGGHVVSAWRKDDGKGVIRVTDEETGAVMWEESFGTAINHTLLVQFNTQVFLFYGETNGTDAINYIEVDGSGPGTTYSYSGSIVTDLNATTGNFDVAAVNDGGTWRVVVGWYSSAGNIKLDTFTWSGTAWTASGSVQTIVGSADADLAVCADPTAAIWIAWGLAGTGVYARHYALDLTGATGTYTVTSSSPANSPFGLSLAVRDSNEAVVVWGETTVGSAALGTWYRTGWLGIDDTVAASTPATPAYCYHVRPATKVYRDTDSGRMCVWTITAGNAGNAQLAADGLQASHLLLDLQDTETGTVADIQPRPVARLNYGSASQWSPISSGRGHVADVAYSSAREQWLAPLEVVYSGNPSDPAAHAVAAAVARYSTYTDHVAPPPPVQWGDLLCFPGSVPTAWDGERLFELGFCWWPEQIKATSSNGAGSLANSGVYQYALHYEWTDAKGNVHRSGVSPTLSITLGVSDDTVDINIGHLSVTRRDETLGTAADDTSPVVVQVYRTSDAGTLFRRVTDENSSATSDPRAANYATYTDVAADATIASNPLLYTINQLDNYPPPACVAMAVHQDRIFCLESEDRFAVSYSKTRIRGEGPAWNPQLRFRVDEDTGPLVAGVSMDDVLYLMTERGLWAVDGSGFGDDGSGVNYEARRIPSLDGCLDARSVALTPDGVMFQSERGICLLPRGGGAPLLLAQVSERLGMGRGDLYGLYAYTRIVGAVTVPDEACTYFATAGNAGVDAELLVYDHQHQMWIADYVGESYSAPNTTNVGAWAGAVLWRDPTSYPVPPGATSSLRPHRLVLVSSAQAYLQAATYTDQTEVGDQTYYVETGEIRLASLQGYHRFRAVSLLGTYLASASHTLKVWYDGKATHPLSGGGGSADATKAFTPATIASHDRYSVQWWPARQKCEAIVVGVESTDLSGGWSGLTLEYGTYPGDWRAPPTVGARRA